MHRSNPGQTHARRDRNNSRISFSGRPVWLPTSTRKVDAAGQRQLLSLAPNCAVILAASGIEYRESSERAGRLSHCGSSRQVPAPIPPASDPRVPRASARIWTYALARRIRQFRSAHACHTPLPSDRTSVTGCVRTSVTVGWWLGGAALSLGAPLLPTQGSLLRSLYDGLRPPLTREPLQRPGASPWGQA
jgi:hypothetical protein